MTQSKKFHGTKLWKYAGEYQLSLSPHYSPGDPDAPRDLANSLSTALWAAVLTTQPTKQSPLNVRIGIRNEWLKDLTTFSDDPQWKVSEPVPRRRSRSIQGKLVWDPAHSQLSSGSIPRGKLKRRT